MLTANSILVNPVKGSSHMAPRSLIINSLTEKASSMSIKIQSVRVNKLNNLIVHMKLASSSSSVVYDVIFEFINIKRIVGNKVMDGVFKDKTEMKVFSNSPEFVFTYAYSYNKLNYLINEYKEFIDPIALTVPPKVRNPNSEIGISTSLFYCLKYLESIRFFGNYGYAQFLNSKETKPLHSNIVYKMIQNENKKNKLRSKR